MKRITRLIIIVCVVSCSFLLNADDVIVQNCEWDGINSTLKYKLTGRSIVKIRAGSADGPVYQTIVNLEERPAGDNKEVWNRKDSNNSDIDFSNYGPFHFCVDTKPLMIPDARLTVSVKDLSEIIIDIPENIKTEFTSNPLEVRVFIDNKLKKQTDIDTYPYSVKIDLSKLEKGKHLLSINCFQKVIGGACGYGNVILDIEGSSPLPAEDKSEGTLNAVNKSDIKMVYSKYIDGFWQICLYDTKTQTESILTDTLVDKLRPDWSPDGKRIAYATNTGELWILDTNTRDSHKIDLPIYCAEPRWSPDGKRVVFTSYADLYHSNTKLWIIDVDTNELTKITNLPFLQYHPEWSANGESIIFVDGPELYGQEIRRLNLKTGDVTQLTDNGPYDFDLYPVCGSSDNIIVYSSNKSGNYDIWVMDEYGREPRNLTNNTANDTMPVISGDKIYFISDRNGSEGVWEMDIDGSHVSPVLFSQNEIRGLSVFGKEE